MMPCAGPLNLLPSLCKCNISMNCFLLSMFFLTVLLASMNALDAAAEKLSTLVGSFNIPNTISGHLNLLLVPHIQFNMDERILVVSATDGAGQFIPKQYIGKTLPVVSLTFFARFMGAFTIRFAASNALLHRSLA